MEKAMRENNVPMFTLETRTPLAECDIVGFSLLYEMCYTNILTMLDLAHIHKRSADRGENEPIIVAGGGCACNPEPIADFMDAIMIGDGEDMIMEVCDAVLAAKEAGLSRRDTLKKLAAIRGVYVPAFYEEKRGDNGEYMGVDKTEPSAPDKVERRILMDLDRAQYIKKPIVPYIPIVHDRIALELFRGCTKGCRFCQAGFLNRPLREKSPETVEAQCRSICEKTGYDEISLCSLSTSDYRGLEKLITDMLPWTVENKINISLPSLRADNFPKELMEQLNAVRRSGLTFAPEAGTQRLRDVINKNITEEEVLSTARQAFAGGWTAVKLYFMIGLPTETEEDIRGIADLAQAVVDEFYHNENKPKGKGVNVSVSVASLVPKPFTPFQWEPQDRPDTLIEKQNFLISCVKTRKVSVSRHVPWTSFLEGVFARGDRRLCDVIETAWRKGCKFDSWEEHLDREKWMDSFAENGIDPFFYTARKRSFDEVLPWDHMDYGVTKKFLIKENEKAHRGETTASCREKCAGCGAARLNGGVCNEIRQNMV